MDSILVEVIDESWWKVILVTMALVFAMIAVKITLKFDFNDWAKQRRTTKQEKELRKIAAECHHGWTLYHASPYSQCNLCMAYIPTAILLNVRKFGIRPPAMILAENHSLIAQLGKGAIIVTDYLGRKD